MTKNYKDKIFTIPNIISMFRLALIIPCIWIYCVNKNYALTATLLVVSAISDVIDGFISRRFNMISDLGKMLDPIADKMTQLAMLLCLITRFSYMAVPLVLLVIKETFMGVTGLVAIKKTNVVHGAKWHGKLNTCLLYAMMFLHIIWYSIPPMVSNITVTLCVFMMTVSLVLYLISNIKKIKRPEQNKYN